MGAKYIKQEIPDLQKTGKSQCYYRMDILRNVDTAELIERMTRPGSAMDRGRVIQVITALSENISRLLANGYSVTVDGIGTFTAALGVRKDMEQDSIDGDDVKRNARTIEVTGVNYRADKDFVHQIDRNCELTKGYVNRLHRSPYTKEQRWQMAVDYVSDPAHTMMSLTDYMRLTKVSKSTASIELQEYRRLPESEITTYGCGKHIVYIKKPKE